ncbi:11171_t:CDS:1, partial [Gigaspora rosea]
PQLLSKLSMELIDTLVKMEQFATKLRRNYKIDALGGQRDLL